MVVLEALPMTSYRSPKEPHKYWVGREAFEVGERYCELKPIGGGAYGYVVSAIDTLAPIEYQNVAIKKIGDVFCDDHANRVLTEIKLLKQLDGHEVFVVPRPSNIISILDVITIPRNEINFKDLYIVTNLMESDMDRIICSNQNLSNEHFQYFLYQILRGLKYIHSADILHRDLKPSNLLVNANCDLSICDFGLATVIDAEDMADVKDYVVTRWYRAPELLCNSRPYGKAIDMWSVGCIFAEMINRQPFFQGDDTNHQLKIIVSILGIPSEEDLRFVDKNAPERKVILSCPLNVAKHFESYFPADTNTLALDLLRSMLTFNPEKRITVNDAIMHPYLASLRGQMGEPVCPKHYLEWGSSFKENYNDLKEVFQKVLSEDAPFLQFCPHSVEMGSDAKVKGGDLGNIGG